jgi:hypothetical protein
LTMSFAMALLVTQACIGVAVRGSFRAKESMGLRRAQSFTWMATNVLYVCPTWQVCCVS